jgi:hypothetical protein
MKENGKQKHYYDKKQRQMISYHIDHNVFYFF